MRWQGIAVAAGALALLLCLSSRLGPKERPLIVSWRARDLPTDYQHPVLFWLVAGPIYGGGMYAVGSATNPVSAAALSLLWGLGMYVATVRYPRRVQRTEARAVPAHPDEAG